MSDVLGLALVLCLIPLRKAHLGTLMLVWWLASCIDLPVSASPLQQTALGLQAQRSGSPAGLVCQVGAEGLKSDPQACTVTAPTHGATSQTLFAFLKSAHRNLE